jgi:hydrogenase nickel incorporation protein HypB
MVEIVVMKAVSADNQAHADRVRNMLNDHKVIGLNMISSPGAGKTTLLERTIKDNPDLRFGIVEGDMFTARDAARIEAVGAKAVQLNTEGSCHLTAHMIETVLPKFNLDELDYLIVENIGNLICPSAFSLGMHKRVVLLSSPEGADKVLKYPNAFNTANLILITKTDMAEAAGFDIKIVSDDLKSVNPDVEPWLVSSKTGDGLDRWYEWLRSLKQTS